MPRRRATPAAETHVPVSIATNDTVTTIANNAAVVSTAPSLPEDLITSLVSMRDSSSNIEQSFSERPIATQSEADFINTVEARASAVKRAVEGFFAPHKQRAYEAHRALCASERQTLQPVNAVVALCRSLLTSWNRRETDRLRANAISEAEMLSALDEVLGGESASSSNGEVAPVSVVVAPALPGATFVTRYVAVIDDFAALVQAVARGEVSHTVLQPNQHALDAMAREMRHELRIPGIRVAEVDGMRRS